MSQTLGRMLICDRCGVAVFEPWHNPWLDDKGEKKVFTYEYTHYLYFERTKDWVSPDSFDVGERPCNNSIKTLCPECEAERKNVMKQFWNGK